MNNSGSKNSLITWTTQEAALQQVKGWLKLINLNYFQLMCALVALETNSFLDTL